VAVSLAQQSRADVAALTESAERRLDGLFAPAARALGEAAAAGGPGPMTQERRREVLRAADAVLDRLYGPVQGMSSPVASAVASHAVAAYAAPQAREAARLAAVLRDREETALLAAIVRGEPDGTT